MTQKTDGMERYMIEQSWTSRDIRLEKGDVVVMLGEGGWPHTQQVLVRTQHGRRIRIPRQLLSKESTPFSCQLCEILPFATYSSFIHHLIENHLKVQLLQGLDSSPKGSPKCPFPGCASTKWSSLDNLVLHYATQHSILEKILVLECELAINKLRDGTKKKETFVRTMTKEAESLQKKVSDMARLLKDKDDKVSRMKELTKTVEKLKEEIKQSKEDEVKQDLKVVSTTEELDQIKDDLKNCENSYDEVFKKNNSLETDLANMKKSTKEKYVEIYELKEEISKLKVPSKNPGTEIDYQQKENESLKVTNNSLEEKVKTVSQELKASEEALDKNKKELRKVIEEKTAAMELCGQLNDVIQSEENILKVEIKSLTIKLDSMTKEQVSFKSQNESLQRENETWQKRNSTLMTEIENLHGENLNLREIIEVGKSTVETAKSISQDLAQKHKQYIEKEIQSTENLQSLEKQMKTLEEEHKRCYEKERRATESLQAIEKEFRDLAQEHKKCKEKDKQSSGYVESVESELKEFKKENKKLILSQQNQRNEISKITKEKTDIIKLQKKTFEEKIKSLQDLLKANEEKKRDIEGKLKAAVSELKSLKSESRKDSEKAKSLDEQKLELANVNQELSGVRSELKVRSNELKMSRNKFIKLSEEMTSVTEDIMREQTKRNEMESELKLSKERELVLSVENNSLKLSNSGYQKRQEDLKREIIILKGRWEKLIEKERLTIKENEVKVKLLEENVSFYKDQEKVFVYEIDILKEEIAKVKEGDEYLTARSINLEKQNEEFKKKIEQLQNDMDANRTVRETIPNEQNSKVQQSELEDVQNKLVKMSAQMRRKDWEIENYQKKIDEIQYAHEVKMESVHNQEEAQTQPRGELKTEPPHREDQREPGATVNVGSSWSKTPIKVEPDDDISAHTDQIMIAGREVNNNKSKAVASQQPDEETPPCKKPRLQLVD